MGFNLSLDLGDQEWADLDASSVQEPGWFRCVIDDVKESPDNPGIYQIVFKVVAGPHRGSVIYDRLNDPTQAADENGAKMALKRLGIYAKRLGLADGSSKCFDLDLSRLVGKECYVHMVKKPGKDRDGNTRDFVNVDFAGIFALTDERVNEEARKKFGPPLVSGNGSAATPTPSSSAGSAKKKPPVDYGNL